MDQITKQARVLKASLDEGEMSLINAQALRPLAAEEVYTFRLAACNNQVDRDVERFTENTLAELAKLFVGRPVLLDHKWSAGSQTARVYAAGVEPMEAVQDGQQLVLRCYMPRLQGNRPVLLDHKWSAGSQTARVYAAGVEPMEAVQDGQQLVLRCYMPRLQGNGDTIAAIESGLLRECSVGVAVRKAVCSICGADRMTDWCEHHKGLEYGDKRCHIDLDGATDAYEVSLLPVPAQPAAGIVKRFGGPDGPKGDPTGKGPGEDTAWQDEALLELEKLRF